MSIDTYLNFVSISLKLIAATLFLLAGLLVLYIAISAIIWLIIRRPR